MKISKVDAQAKKSLLDRPLWGQQQKSDRWTSHLMRNIVKVKTIIPSERWQRYLEILITLYRIVRTNWTWRGGQKRIQPWIDRLASIGGEAKTCIKCRDTLSEDRFIFIPNYSNATQHGTMYRDASWCDAMRRFIMRCNVTLKLWRWICDADLREAIREQRP